MRLPWRRRGPSPWAFFADFPRVLPYLRPRKKLAGASMSMVGVSSLMALLEPWPLDTMPSTMKRLPILLATSLVTLLVLAPAAFAHDGGEGIYGPAPDKVVTNAGFILIAFFPLFILVMSLLQWRLDKRKAEKKQAHKALAGDEQAWRGGW